MGRLTQLSSFSGVRPTTHPICWTLVAVRTSQMEPAA